MTLLSNNKMTLLSNNNNKNNSYSDNDKNIITKIMSLRKS